MEPRCVADVASAVYLPQEQALPSFAHLHSLAPAHWSHWRGCTSVSSMEQGRSGWDSGGTDRAGLVHAVLAVALALGAGTTGTRGAAGAVMCTGEC